jgi:sugar lactone lactonase YvrE
MGRNSWECVVDGFGRLEAPCFDLEGRLCFADRRPPGAIFRLEADGSVTEVAKCEAVGGLVPHADGGLVVSARTVSVLEPQGDQRVVSQPVGGWGFNDSVTDADGNLFVGMHGEQPTGEAPAVTASLWKLSRGGEATMCYDGIQMTNGVGLSPDGSRLYHNDTTPRTVWVSDISADGLPIDRRAFFELNEGGPDGMAMDESGCVWIAAITAGRVVRVTPDGKEDLTVETPSKWVASLCFGGPDGRDLYVVTFGGEPYDPERSGAVYRTRVAASGAPVVPATI